MDEKDGGSTTRLSRVKTAMTDLMSGNVSKKMIKLVMIKLLGYLH
jgi:hypothetical protein